MNSGLNKQAKNRPYLTSFGGSQPAGGGDDFSVIGYLFRQERLFQVFGLYLFEKIGVLLKVHCGLPFGDDYTNFLIGTKLL